MEKNISAQTQLHVSSLNQTFLWQMNSVKSFFTKQIKKLNEKFNLTQSLLINKSNDLQNQFTLYRNQSNQQIKQQDEKFNLTRSLLIKKINDLQNQFTLNKNQSNQQIQELDKKLNITNYFRGKV